MERSPWALKSFINPNPDVFLFHVSASVFSVFFRGKSLILAEYFRNHLLHGLGYFQCFGYGINHGFDLRKVSPMKLIISSKLFLSILRPLIVALYSQRSVACPC